MRTINGVLKYFSYILKYKWTAKIIIGANTSKKKKILCLGLTRRFSPTESSVIGCVLRDRLDYGESLVYLSLGKCKTLLPATGSHAVCRSNKEGLPLEVFSPTKQRL
jgi:hypothetical protein